MSKCQLYKYDKENYLLKEEDADFFSQNFTKEIDETHNCWLNYHGLDEIEKIEGICKSLEIDKFCVDSIFSEIKRAKVEEYDNYLFFSIKSALSSEDLSKYIISEKLTFVLGKNYLISFQEKPSDYFTHLRTRIKTNKGSIRKKSTDFLLFRMLESIIDNYFNVVEDINDEIDQIGKSIYSQEDETILGKIEILKRKLIELRKIAIPMREVTIQLEDLESDLISKSNHHYFNNLMLLCDSVIDEIDASKQILDGLSNLYYAVQGQRMNEIMKILTIVSSIFIPLTFIAGVYGMNFTHMPELIHPYGYFIVMGVMIIIGIALFLYFWKKGWLKKIIP